MGKLMGIAVKRDKNSARMELLEEAEIASEIGVVGDYRGVFSDRRRVIVLSNDQWQRVCEAVKVPWEARMANLLIQGISFGPKEKGRSITIGEHVELEITGAVGRCPEQAEWAGGVLCRVIRNGRIKIGDEVEFKFEP